MTILKLPLRSCVAALVFSLAAVPAMAQGHRGKGAKSQSDPQASADKNAKDAKLDNDYRTALSWIPDQKPADPWGTVRPTPEKAKSTH